jgi:hypothetical protein
MLNLASICSLFKWVPALRGWRNEPTRMSGHGLTGIASDFRQTRADPVDLPSRASPASSQKSRTRTRTIGRPPGGLHRLVAWTRSQKIDIDGLRHGLETSPVWMKEIAGAADRHVRLEGRFNSSSRRIQGGGIKIRHGVK